MTPALTIITGGQTGVDTAAIKAANKLNIPYKGWVPKGYTNEAGLIPHEYWTYLQPTPLPDNAQRTEWNTREADSVLTILRGPAENAVGGTKLGVEYSTQAGKKMCFVDLQNGWREEVEKVRTWLSEVAVGSCAIGGPRESEEPGIEEEATTFLLEVLAHSAPEGPGNV